VKAIEGVERLRQLRIPIGTLETPSCALESPSVLTHLAAEPAAALCEPVVEPSGVQAYRRRGTDRTGTPNTRPPLGDGTVESRGGVRLGQQQLAWGRPKPAECPSQRVSHVLLAPRLGKSCAMQNHAGRAESAVSRQRGGTGDPQRQDAHDPPAFATREDAHPGAGGRQMMPPGELPRRSRERTIRQAGEAVPVLDRRRDLVALLNGDVTDSLELVGDRRVGTALSWAHGRLASGCRPGGDCPGLQGLCPLLPPHERGGSAGTGDGPALSTERPAPRPVHLRADPARC
jgi:hypothetical protein